MDFRIEKDTIGEIVYLQRKYGDPRHNEASKTSKLVPKGCRLKSFERWLF